MHFPHPAARSRCEPFGADGRRPRPRHARGACAHPAAACQTSRRGGCRARDERGARSQLRGGRRAASRARPEPCPAGEAAAVRANRLPPGPGSSGGAPRGCRRSLARGRRGSRGGGDRDHRRAERDPRLRAGGRSGARGARSRRPCRSHRDGGSRGARGGDPGRGCRSRRPAPRARRRPDRRRCPARRDQRLRGRRVDADRRVRAGREARRAGTRGCSAGGARVDGLRGHRSHARPCRGAGDRDWSEQRGRTPDRADAGHPPAADAAPASPRPGSRARWLP